MICPTDNTTKKLSIHKYNEHNKNKDKTTQNSKHYSELTVSRYFVINKTIGPLDHGIDKTTVHSIIVFENHRENLTGLAAVLTGADNAGLGG